MRIRDILRRKGDAVATVRPVSTVRELLATLAEHNIGAVVVSPDGVAIGGIASERDVVRHMHRRGAALLDAPVSEIMTAEVRTCGPDDAVDGLRHVMTERRIRHVPCHRFDHRPRLHQRPGQRKCHHQRHYPRSAARQLVHRLSIRCRDRAPALARPLRTCLSSNLLRPI